MASRILVVEDQFIEANNLKITLKRAGYDVCPLVRSVSEALQVLETETPDLVLLDIFLSGPQTGIDLATILQAKGIPFVYLSANSDRKTLDAAKTTQPYGFLVKPFREKDVLIMLDVALYRHRQPPLFIEKRLVADATENNGFDHVIGQSKCFCAVIEAARMVGRTESSVLILGESGTGKELIAKGVHAVSPRRNKPFIVVNCGALPASLIESELFGHEKGAFTGAVERRIGKFEQAHEGTIFLDEIGELPMDLQVKFLRVLQEREIEPVGGQKKAVNVRVIAATNRNLEEELIAGRFRIDLFYRLNVFPLTLPALRERKEDILPLANHFIEWFARRENKSVAGMTDQVIASLCSYDWPGNVRELENIIERTVVMASGRMITSIVLPAKQDRAASRAGRPKTMVENERDHILAVLERCSWKLYGPGGAAEMLEINGATLHSRMKKLGIERSVSFKKPK
jgi:two-component system, NtrC family, response regulator HydG